MTGPAWIQKLPLRVINTAADSHGLDRRMIMAICQHESNCNPWVYRYEPGAASSVTAQYIATARSVLVTAESERIAQMTSWGLGQVMGWVARNLGFMGPLPQLCDPAVGIEYQCKLLAQLTKRFTFRDDVISAYNQGSPRKTPGGVFLNQVTYVTPIVTLIDQISLD